MDAQARPGPPGRMTVDEYFAWAEMVPGRYELDNGIVVAMSPERAQHAEVKFAVQVSLHDAIRRAAVPCRMLPDGMTVRIDEHTAFEPDALVYCGPRIAPQAVEVPDPVIVVEVVSPGTRGVDIRKKVFGYLALQSIAHYLILEPETRAVVHHRRITADRFETSLVHGGTIDLDPPGLRIALDDIFGSLLP